MIISLTASVCLVALCFFLHFAVLRRLATMVGRSGSAVRRPILKVLFALFALHLVEVSLYAFGIALLDWARLGSLTGEIARDEPMLIEYVYFSIASYTTLGIGDIIPHGGMRIIAGIEALNGLVLITWSASFTYLTMERFWGKGATIEETDA